MIRKSLLKLFLTFILSKLRLKISFFKLALNCEPEKHRVDSQASKTGRLNGLIFKKIIFEFILVLNGFLEGTEKKDLVQQIYRNGLLPVVD